MKSLFIVLLAGLLFGAGLAISGMTNPAKVIGFLDLTGDWDPTLAYVMGGAVAVFAIGSLLIRGLPKAESDPVTMSLVVGSILFGVGWGLGGFCPGPALANLAAFRAEALCFVPAMAVGMILAQRLFGLDR
ncbi:MAG: DUF6691 family protein [Verrucomicrobiota bacterium]